MVLPLNTKVAELEASDPGNAGFTKLRTDLEEVIRLTAGLVSMLDVNKIHDYTIDWREKGQNRTVLCSLLLNASECEVNTPLRCTDCSWCMFQLSNRNGTLPITVQQQTTW